MTVTKNGSMCRINALNRTAAFLYEFDSSNSPCAVRMNDFTWKKHLKRVRNAESDSNVSVHAQGIKSPGSLGGMEAYTHA